MLISDKFAIHHGLNDGRLKARANVPTNPAIIDDGDALFKNDDYALVFIALSIHSTLQPVPKANAAMHSASNGHLGQKCTNFVSNSGTAAERELLGLQTQDRS
eukprot:scaffold61057_cov15-Prasinocladus_malaysianus.AAC.2